MFEQMGKSGVAGLLVFRPDVIPDVDGDDGTPAILVQEHVETVVERVLREGEPHLNSPHVGIEVP
jgi:hypothetical protein